MPIKVTIDRGTRDFRRGAGYAEVTVGIVELGIGEGAAEVTRHGRVISGE